MRWSRTRGLGTRRKLDAELNEELRGHIEMAARDSARSGMNPSDAEFDARRRFGNLTLEKERTRDVKIFGALETFLQDVRFGLRMLRKNPGFASVAILTLALGIGANTAIFSVVNAVLIRPLPFAQPERLVRIFEKKRQIEFAAIWKLRFELPLVERAAAILRSNGTHRIRHPQPHRKWRT